LKDSDRRFAATCRLARIHDVWIVPALPHDYIVAKCSLSGRVAIGYAEPVIVDKHWWWPVYSFITQ